MTVKKLTDIKRADIIQAAKDEVRSFGFSGTSMDRIAESANVSKRTVYNHFESKEALWAAAAEELCNVFSQVSEHPYQPDKPLKNQLEAIASQQLEMLCSERFLRSFKMFVTETLATPSLAKPITDSIEKENMGLMKWISAAAKDGRLSVKDPVMAGKQFIALLEAFTSWPYLVGMDRVEKKQEQRELVESTVAMFLDHYEIRP
jgi:TetR/AcrR family transcriptional regulator of autoinduction and epiphytic fitness